jgi:hypothetical protein
MEWSRTRLLAVMSAAVVIVFLLLGGFVLAVRAMLTQEHATDRRSAEDPQETLLAPSRPGPVTTAVFPKVMLPPSTVLGPAGVRSGFPRTPQGALAQLAAIDQAALQSGSVPGVQEVIRGWAQPGGPTPESWSGVQAMAEFLTSAGLPATGSLDLALSATPVLGKVGGSHDEPVLACVDFVVTAALTSTARVVVADCQQMTWHTGRWMVAPGDEPAQAPSVWPGTQAALDSGYEELAHD